MNYRNIEKAAKAQGWRSEVRKSGVMWLSPNGQDSVMWHNTPSDVRALKNFLSLMRKAGLVYPPPKR
jgi:hypothetical protein